MDVQNGKLDFDITSECDQKATFHIEKQIPVSKLLARKACLRNRPQCAFMPFETYSKIPRQLTIKYALGLLRPNTRTLWPIGVRPELGMGATASGRPNQTQNALQTPETSCTPEAANDLNFRMSWRSSQVIPSPQPHYHEGTFLLLEPLEANPQL